MLFNFEPFPVNTRHVKITSGVDIHEGTAWYLMEERLAPAHYSEFPVTTDPGEVEHDGFSSTLSDYRDYLQNGAVTLVRNNRHNLLMGGFLVGSIGPAEGTVADSDEFRFIITRSKDWECNCKGSCTSRCGVLADFPVPIDADETEILDRAERHSPMGHELLKMALDLRNAGVDGSETTMTSAREEVSVTYDAEDDKLSDLTFLKAVGLNEEDATWWPYSVFPYWAKAGHQGTTGSVADAGLHQLLGAYQNVDNRLETLDEVSDSDPEAIDGEHFKDVLSPSHLETLCSEYLRAPDAGPAIDQFDGYQHVFPSGGSLRGADTVAVTDDGTRIATQVTHKGAKDEKFRKLAAYAGETGGQETILYYFGTDVDATDVPDDIEPEIRVRSVGDVLDHMADSALVREMLRVPDPPGDPGTTLD
jgi:hypothetical protein